MKPVTLLLAGWASLIGAAGAVSALEPISVKKFTDLHVLIKPGADEEKFLQIPWLTSLGEARARAAAEGKPILLWEMDGHPLGCV